MNSEKTHTGPKTPGSNSGIRAVGRAIGDLRRGIPVILNGGDAAMLVAAAEAGNDPASLRTMSGAEVSLLVPPSRAEALGLDTVEGAIVSITPKGALTADNVARLIGESAEHELPIGGADQFRSYGGNGIQESALQLVKLARLLPAALVAPINGEAMQLARDEDLLSVSTGEVDLYRDAAGKLSSNEISAQVPLLDAEETKLVAFRPADGGKAHLAIVIGDPDPDSAVLIRLHSECFTGDLLGSLRCDCGDQLRGAVAAISAAGGGVLLYLAQEGRGIGLANKLRAYQLQDEGFDTIEANEALGFDADERVYAPAAEIMVRLGYTKVRLLTNNPAKVAALSNHGIEITARIPHAFPSNGHNEQYLRTKASRSGHLF